MPTKPPPRVRLEPVFVRDHQRRLRLVMEVLEQELHRQARRTEQEKKVTISDGATISSRSQAQIGGQVL